MPLPEETYETARSRLQALAVYYEKHAADRNEATTRMHLIDTLFFECLAWERAEWLSEERFADEYADYTFPAP